MGPQMGLVVVAIFVFSLPFLVLVLRGLQRSTATLDAAVEVVGAGV